MKADNAPVIADRQAIAAAIDDNAAVKAAKAKRQADRASFNAKIKADLLQLFQDRKKLRDDIKANA